MTRLEKFQQLEQQIKTLTESAAIEYSKGKYQAVLMITDQLPCVHYQLLQLKEESNLLAIQQDTAVS